MRLDLTYLSGLLTFFLLHVASSEDTSRIDGGAEEEPLASGKRQHSIMRFGKRPDGHALLRFGKRFFAPLPPYLAPYFDEGSAPKRGHSIMRFGKRGPSSPPSAAHSFIRFGRGGAQHAMIHFGKRDDLDEDKRQHSMMYFGKRDDQPEEEDKRAGQHSMMYFGKRDDLQDEDKRAHAMIHFGKRGPNSHAMIHFGKKSDEDVRSLDRKKRDMEPVSWEVPDRALEGELNEFSLLQPPFEYDPQGKRDAHSFLRFG